MRKVGLHMALFLPGGTWTYTPDVVSPENNSPYLRLGFNSDNSDYYIDDIRLKGPDFNTYPDGTLNLSNPASISSSYTTYDSGINIPADTELNVYSSRYTYWLSAIIGSGRLNIHSGGERSYIGNGSGTLPDWDGFRGEVHVYPWPEVNTSVKAGFYGKILAHGGVKYELGNAKKSIREGRYTTLLAENKVVLHDCAPTDGFPSAGAIP